jgi:type VI secretion system protein ImpE
VDPTDVDALIRAGQLREAIAAAEAQVRAEPADVSLRVLLFNLAVVACQWDRAAAQAQLAGSMDQGCGWLTLLADSAIPCEVVRTDVFVGKRSPMILGEPQPWMATLLEANTQLALGQPSVFAQLRAQAIEHAGAIVGSVDDSTFTNVEDTDARLGPMLEAFVDKKYYWIPWSRIASLVIDKPTNLWNLAWITATATWQGGGQLPILLPARYPMADALADGQAALGQKTEWDAVADGLFVGRGQRVWSFFSASGPDERSILDTREVRTHSAEASNG